MYVLLTNTQICATIITVSKNKKMKNTTKSAVTILGTFLVIGVVSSAGLHLKDAVSASLKVDGRKESMLQNYTIIHINLI
jgi:hypothetical protein